MTAPWTERVVMGTGTQAVTLDGLELDAGLRRVALALLPSLPRLAPPPGAGAPWSVRGVAVVDGRVFWVAGDGRTVHVRECDGSTPRFGCAGGGAGTLGALVAAQGDLYVAAPEAGTVVAYDTTDGQAVATWAGLDHPRDLTASADGAVYAAVASGVVRLERGGTTVGVAELVDVRSIAWLPAAEGSWQIAAAVGDDPAVMVVIHPDGSTEPGPRVPGGPDATGPLLVRGGGDRLLVVAAWAGTAWLYDLGTASWLGRLPGDAVGLVGAAADHRSVWWLGDGSSVQPTETERWAEHGALRLGPVEILPDPEGGRRSLLRLKLRGRLEPVSVLTTVTFGRHDGLPPAGGAVDEAPGRPCTDRLLRVPPGADTVTVVVELSDPPAGTEDPAGRHWLEAVELRFDEIGLLDALPTIYRSQGDPEAFLDPFLRLLSSGNDDVVDVLLDLPQQFDPATATDDLDGDRWLDWLASWVDARIDERWSPDLRRRVVADAFRAHGRRGTAEAIRERIALELGIDARIVEPGDLGRVWVLGADDAGLGITAMLADAPPWGSVLDVSAVVDRSHLIGPGDVGAPLFGDLAHRFDVVVDAAAVAGARLAALTEVVEREKPAHARAHVCRIEPGIVVGLGGRIGTDLVIGPPAPEVGGLDGFGAAPGRPRLGDPIHEPLVLA